MISDTKIANAMSGRTAQACDCCIRRRARWYCEADDAFLCQACDVSVHSANPLARRHKRVRLKTASAPIKQADPFDLPSWQRGFNRKARTPRHGKHHPSVGHQGLKSEVTVPELGAEETTSSHGDEPDEQLLFQVPIFNPFVEDQYLEMEGLDVMKRQEINKCSENEYQALDLELEEFAANVESLLGKGLDEECYGIEELGFLGSCNNRQDFLNVDCPFDYVKLVKEEEGEELECKIGGENVENAFDLGFEVYDEEEKREVMMKKVEDEEEKDERKLKKRKILLSLDYDAISAAWATQSEGSPWINGQRPEINPQDYWPHAHCMLTGNPANGHGGDHGGGMGMAEEKGEREREGRVRRYREKRRRRLFAKKIRYQVRKLNAEKRPRIKGRFIKSSSFAP